MISKERLEELIEQGATIYFINSGFVDCKDSKYHGVEVGNNYASILYGGYCHNIDYENIFETEEDARWELEMTATRTEILKLPTYKQVCDAIYSGSYGVLTIKTFDKITFGYKRQIDDNVYLFVDRLSETQYLGSLTKENYIEACKLCLRLFKGKEL